MNSKDKCGIIIENLKSVYPVPRCTLNYGNALELLIATRLAAQCTDKRVNLTTPKLFAKYKTAKEYAEAEISDIEEIIKPCGFYKVKSADIIAMCKKIAEDFNGEVPKTMEELTSLPGIGRKTANVVLAEIFKKPAVIVDTHFTRLTGRLGFHNTKNAEKIEFLMREIIPKEEQTGFSHRLVEHGRNVCTARNPKCSECVVKEYCNYYKKTAKV